jgi:Copper binding proteins, plastocyanin/azurin family
MRARLLLILPAVALLAAACGSATAQTPTPTPPGAITVELTEWRVVVPSSGPQAGPQTFIVKNTGSIAHDLTILKTDLPADKIPQANGKALEDGRVAGTAELNPGQSTRLAVTLQPGNYVFICNELGHYALGMHTAVKVG